MDRRQFLAIAGAAGSGVLAGCGGTETTEASSPTNTTKTVKHAKQGPPYWENVNLSGPKETAVKENFSITVSAANTGGRTGNFSNTLSFWYGDREYHKTNVKINNIDPGQIKDKTISGLNLETTGEYKVKITDYGATHTINVVPREIAYENPFQLNGIKVIPRDLRIENAIQLEYSNGEPGIWYPEDGNVFVAVILQIENLSNETKRVSSNDFSLKNGEEYMPGYNPRGFTTPGLRNAPLELESLNPGSYITRWLIFSISPEDARGNLRLGWNASIPSDSPEVVWVDRPSSKPRQFEAFKLRKADVPETVVPYSNHTLTFEVKNVGTGQGDFYAEVWSENSSADKILSTILSSGESRTFRFTTQIPPNDATSLNQTFTLGGVTNPKSWTVVPENPELPFGESIETPTNARVTVSAPEFGTRLLTPGFLEEWTKESLDPGYQWAYVYVEVNGSGSSLEGSPYWDAWTLYSREGNIEETPHFGSLMGGSEFRGSVSGNYYNSISFDRRSRVAGYLIYQIPNDITREDVAIVYQSPNYQYDAFAPAWTANQ